MHEEEERREEARRNPGSQRVAGGGGHRITEAPNFVQTTTHACLIKLIKHKSKDLESQSTECSASNPVSGHLQSAGSPVMARPPVMVPSQACGAGPAQNLKEASQPCIQWYSGKQGAGLDNAST